MSGAEHDRIAADPALDFLRAALDEPLGGDRLRIITIPAPVEDATRLFSLDPGPAVYWAGPDGEARVGIGSAATLAAAGSRRFTAVRDAAERLWPRIETRTHPDAVDPGVRVLGGFAFLPGEHPAPWREFGDAAFVLPRLLVTIGPAGSTVSIAVTAKEAAHPEGVLDWLDRVLAHQGAEDPATGLTIERDEPDVSTWVDRVRAVQQRIRDGRVEKVVAARSESVRRPGGWRDPGPVLRRLGREPATVRFAFRFGDATFLGATPERLVKRIGREVRTEALAGTVEAGQEARLNPLLESVKESSEHAFVVRAIAQALEPFCDSLAYPDEPRVQRLRHVHHLQTPFEGRLAGSAHVLDLVARLHPTPAVGGWPTALALDWIRDEEPGDRGWYAAPIGWIGPGGDGEFMVALRSGLLHGDRAELFAGAGIVADSDPRAELEETDVKLRTMREALGIR